jgi:tRNA A-37 threonylcarbamoyl transferase component Bud32
MVSPGDIVSEIFKISQLIYAQVQLVKANKHQCLRLYDRITVITSTLKTLEKIPDTLYYRKGLQALKKCLEDSLKFMKEFAANEWYMLVLLAGTHSGRFAELNEELTKAVQQLELGIQAQQLRDHQQDKNDQAADYQNLCAQQDKIIQLNQDAKRKLQQLHDQQEDHHNVVAQQLESIKLRIKALNVNQSPPPRPLVDPHLQVHYFELTFEKKIAQGSFTRVFRGQWHDRTVAIKILQDHTEANRAQFIREVQIMDSLRHPNIVPLYGVSLEEGNNPCLVMEYLEGGSLFDRLGGSPLTAEQQQRIALDIAHGLQYLHDRDVLHRDLKSSHVLLNNQHEAKLTDFGLAKSQAAFVQTAAERSEAIAWMAPECLEGKDHTPSADIYSYGMLLWEIFTQQRPYTAWKDKKQIEKDVLAGQREKIPDIVVPPLADLIRRCWQPDPQKRPALSEIVKILKDYFSEVNLSPEKQYEKGLQLEKGKQYAEAYAAYQKADAAGYLKAPASLGFFALRGLHNGTPDKAEAFRQFQRGTEKGHARAMYNMALMLEKGDGVEKNLPLALSWYEKAEKLGNKNAREKCEKIRAALAADPKEDYQAYTRR